MTPEGELFDILTPALRAITIRDKAFGGEGLLLNEDKHGLEHHDVKIGVTEDGGLAANDHKDRCIIYRKGTDLKKAEKKDIEFVVHTGSTYSGDILLSRGKYGPPEEDDMFFVRHIHAEVEYFGRKFDAFADCAKILTGKDVRITSGIMLPSKEEWLKKLEPAATR